MIRIKTDIKLLRNMGRIAVTPVGNSLFVTNGMTTVYQYSKEDQTFVNKYIDNDDEHPYPIQQMECTENKLMYIRSNGILYVWSISHSPKLLHKLHIRDQQCVSFSVGAVSQDGELTTVFCVYKDGSVIAWGIGRSGLLKTTISREPHKELCMTFGKGSLFCTSKELIQETGTGPQKVLFQIPDQDIDPVFKKLILLDDNFVFFNFAKGKLCRVNTQTLDVKHYVINDCVLYVYNQFIFVSNRNNKIYQYTESGQKTEILRYHDSEVICMLACNDKLYSCDEDGNVIIYDLHNFEEDSDIWSSLSIEQSSIVSNPSIDQCSNSSILSLESYTKEDDPIMVYMLDSRSKYNKSICFTLAELQSFLESDKNRTFPDHIMAVYSKPRKPDTTGIGSYPTQRIVAKLPVHNIYVTVGSIRKLLNTNIKIWYAVPLFGGKRRRVGNLRGIFGISMNHGQIPGEVIYKLIHQPPLDGNETDSDYPANLKDLSKPLLHSDVDILIDTLLE